MNRPWYQGKLQGALASVPDLHDLLSRSGARMPDVGCGAGRSSIALAPAYPQATVEGYDVDRPSVEMARANAHEVGVAEGVPFHHVDGEEMSGRNFDVVFAFECIHDMPHPVDVLASSWMRRSRSPSPRPATSSSG